MLEYICKVLRKDGIMKKGTAINHEEQGYRRRRVKRIKRLIVGTVIVLILVPTICCIGLLLKVRQLEKQIKNFQFGQLNIEESLVDFDTAFSATVEHAADVLSENVVFYQDEDRNSINKDAENEVLTYEEQLDKTIEKGKVYLTFDDGPGPYTDELLDVLAEYDIKATFFVIGRKDEHSLDMYRRIVDEGHTLAMHSYTHQYGTIYSSVEEFDKDFKKLSNLLYKTTGIRVKLFRFPGGSSNTASRLPMTDFIAYLNENDIVYYDWNVINGDATGKKLTANQMVDMVMSGVRENNNSTVLMHDFISDNTTVKSLPSLIEKLQKENYVMLPITKYTKPVQHTKAETVE